MNSFDDIIQEIQGKLEELRAIITSLMEDKERLTYKLIRAKRGEDDTVIDATEQQWRPDSLEDLFDIANFDCIDYEVLPGRRMTEEKKKNQEMPPIWELRCTCFEYALEMIKYRCRDIERTDPDRTGLEVWEFRTIWMKDEVWRYLNGVSILEFCKKMKYDSKMEKMRTAIAITICEHYGAHFDYTGCDECELKWFAQVMELVKLYKKNLIFLR